MTKRIRLTDTEIRVLEWMKGGTPSYIYEYLYYGLFFYPSMADKESDRIRKKLEKIGLLTSCRYGDGRIRCTITDKGGEALEKGQRSFKANQHGKGE